MPATTDSAVAEHTARPPLPRWTAPTRILVATDGSPASTGAVDLAVAMAAHHRAELVVAHVVPAVDMAMPMPIDQPGVAIPHEPTRREHQVLTTAAATARRREVDVTAVLLAGAAADAIVAYAAANDVDVIVVGSRGHRAVASAIVGSVSLQVLRTSPKPVLVVHGAARP